MQDRTNQKEGLSSPKLFFQYFAPLEEVTMQRGKSDEIERAIVHSRLWWERRQTRERPERVCAQPLGDTGNHSLEGRNTVWETLRIMHDPDG